MVEARPVGGWTPALKTVRSCGSTAPTAPTPAKARGSRCEPQERGGGRVRRAGTRSGYGRAGGSGLLGGGRGRGRGRGGTSRRKAPRHTRGGTDPERSPEGEHRNPADAGPEHSYWGSERRSLRRRSRGGGGRGRGSERRSASVPRRRSRGGGGRGAECRTPHYASAMVRLLTNRLLRRSIAGSGVSA